MTVIIRALCVALVLAVQPAAKGAAGRATDEPQTIPAPADVLRQVGLSQAEIGAVEGGDAVARLVDTDRRQVAVVGAVRIRGARERLVARFRNVDFLRGSTTVLDAAAVGNPPRPHDLNGVRFEPYDLDLRACRPGDCRVRLSAADIMRFQREVDWDAPDWQSQSAAVWRDVLVSYAAGYTRDGARALPVYANKEDSLAVADEQALLLTETAFVRHLAPGLLSHLRDPARGPLPGSEGFLYWSKEDFDIRPVLRMTYQAIYSPPPPAAGSPRPVVIGTTQLYAAHYLDAAVSFLIALEPPAADAHRGFYLIAVNRARTRSLDGFLRRFPRAAVQKRTRNALEKILRAAKATLEEQTSSAGR